jgi:hypothetical protein
MKRVMLTFARFSGITPPMKPPRMPPQMPKPPSQTAIHPYQLCWTSFQLVTSW